MTGFQKLFGKAITISAALSMTAGLALAADGTVSADRIVNALQPKPLTRGLSSGPQVDPAIKANEIGFVKTLRNRNTRSLSLGVREQIAEMAATKPNIDLEIKYAFTPPQISKSWTKPVKKPGRPLPIPNLKGSTSVAPATPTPSVATPSTRISPSAAPTPSSAI